MKVRIDIVSCYPNMWVQILNRKLFQAVVGVARIPFTRTRDGPETSGEVHFKETAQVESMNLHGRWPRHLGTAH